MEILLLVTARAGEPSAVLPALDLLPHSVRTAPRDIRTLVSGPSPDAVMVDARSELSEARATCRMLHATGLGVPLVAVVTEPHGVTGDHLGAAGGAAGFPLALRVPQSSRDTGDVRGVGPPDRAGDLTGGGVEDLRDGVDFGRSSHELMLTVAVI